MAENGSPTEGMYAPSFFTKPRHHLVAQRLPFIVNLKAHLADNPFRRSQALLRTAQRIQLTPLDIELDHIRSWQCLLAPEVVQPNHGYQLCLVWSQIPRRFPGGSQRTQTGRIRLPWNVQFPPRVLVTNRHRMQGNIPVNGSRLQVTRLIARSWLEGMNNGTGINRLGQQRPFPYMRPNVVNDSMLSQAHDFQQFQGIELAVTCGLRPAIFKPRQPSLTARPASQMLQPFEQSIPGNARLIK